MSYPKRSLRLRPRRGISSDLPPWSIPNDQFSGANNIVFRTGMAERAPSVEPVYDPPTVPPYHLLNLQIEGINYWIYAGASTIYAVQTSVHTEVTPAGGLQTNTEVDRFTLASLNGVPIFNNSLDEPQFWDGQVANDFVILPDWTATETCKFIHPFRFHLFAMGIDGPAGAFENQIKWSDAAFPGNVPAEWVASPSNEAGDVTLSDTPGSIISAANLRGTLLIYKNQSIHTANYVGGQEIFAFATIFSQIGALTRHSVVDINGRHLVVSDGDIAVTDGATIQSVVQNRRRRFLFRQLDQDNYRNLFCVFHPETNEVWVCFPEAGSSLCTRAMIYDVANDAWGDRALPGIAHGAIGVINDVATDETWDADNETWDADLTTWNQQNFSLASDELVLANVTDTELDAVNRGSQNFISLVQKYSMDFGEPERYKFVKRMHVRIEADPSIVFVARLGSQDTAEGPITWQPNVTFSSQDGFIDALTLGRFISFEIAAETDRTFRITGVDLETELRGYH